VEVILFAKCAKSRGMVGGRPDAAGLELVRATYRAECLGIWGLENTDHPPAAGHQIATDRLHSVQLETAGPGSEPPNVFGRQRLFELTLEDNPFHATKLPQFGGDSAKSKV